MTTASSNGHRHDYRCRSETCSRLLFRAYLAPDTKVEIRCPKCGAVHVFDAVDSSVEHGIIVPTAEANITA